MRKTKHCGIGRAAALSAQSDYLQSVSHSKAGCRLGWRSTTTPEQLHFVRAPLLVRSKQSRKIRHFRVLLD
jgi:hypothetical protein